VPAPEPGEALVTPPAATPAFQPSSQLSQRVRLSQQDGPRRQDLALDSLAAAAKEEASGILERLVRRLQNSLAGRYEGDLGEAIVSAFPELPGNDLEDLIARSIFSANLFGRATVDDEVTTAAGGTTLRLDARGRLALAGGTILLEPLPFDEAIAWFEQKHVVGPAIYQRLIQESKATAFSVSGLTRLDLLNDLHDSLQEALETGADMGTWRREIGDHLMEKGWFGTTPLRLNNIFLTNIREAYSAGRWERQNDPYVKERRPYLQYKTMEDGNVRPEHAAWNDTILPTDDPWWSTHYPPNDWGCRCFAVSVSPDELREEGLKVAKQPPPGQPGPGWDYNPGTARNVAADVLHRVNRTYPPRLQAEFDALKQRAADRKPKAKGGK
jgi:SPP1 gp7 family putative phage head morphogenesis protein